MTKYANAQKLFPPEDVAGRIALVERFWAREPIDEPIICPVSWNYNYVNNLDPDITARKFAAALEYYASFRSSYVPAFNCWLGSCALASAFGGQTSQNPDSGLFWIEPIVRQPDDVYRLKAPAVHSGLVGKGIDNYHYMLEHVEGYVPPRVPDMQGPLNVASMIWEQGEFLLAMYDSPEAVHHLLGLVTDYTIAVYRHFRDAYEAANLVSWPFIYMPRSMGVGMTEDFMHLLSPALYEEFGLPYVNRIAREFGGLYIHCCGVFKQHWPVVSKIHNLRGLDTMYSFSKPQELFAEFPDIVHTMWLDYGEGVRSFGGKRECFTQFMLDQTPRGPKNMRFIYTPDFEGEVMARQIELIRKGWR